MEISTKAAALRPMIGNTPLLEIELKYKGTPLKVYAKAEYLNLSGSIKDRVALYILEKAYREGKIHAGDTIVEATSGNTGISFSAIGRYFGHNVIIFMPDWMREERISLTESFGAEVRLVSREQGGFLGSISMAEELGKEKGVFLPRQFSNEDNCEAHYSSTGEEIVRQMGSLNLRAGGFVAGVGTGGTVMGVCRRVTDETRDIVGFPLEPLNSPTLSTGYKGGIHRIAGISDEFIPDIVKLNELGPVVSVDDADAIIMARMLSETLGLGVGISSGANLIGAVIAAAEHGAENVATVFADDSKKYLSTDYRFKQDRKNGEYSKNIELIGYRAVR